MYIDKNSIDSFIMALYMHFYLFYLFVIWILMCMQMSAREIRNTENLTLKNVNIVGDRLQTIWIFN